MSLIIWILLASFLTSLIALIGIFTLGIKSRVLNKIIFALVGLAAGTLLADAFIHLIPESAEKISIGNTGILVLGGIVLFFLIERILKWRHCHEGICSIHTFTHMSIIGDSVHNFLDGLIIAASFSASIPIGIATSLAIIAHEVPQEIGDFAILVHGGFSKTKALLFNFLTALTAIFGAVLGYFLSSISSSTSLLLAFAAGGFIYVAASDLIPELHKESDSRKAWLSFIFFIVGIILMWILKILLS